MAINEALEVAKETQMASVPLYLRNAPTKLMKQLGYSDGYKYAHSYEGNFVEQQFLPDEINGTRFWTPQHNASEDKLKERMEQIWKRKY
jgi:putative ATPase